LKMDLVKESSRDYRRNVSNTHNASGVKSMNSCWFLPGSDQDNHLKLK
jgi:hypothetical protein